LFEHLNRFSHAARRVLVLAQHEAYALGQEVTRTEHVLLALLRSPSSPPLRILEDLGVTPAALRREILARVEDGSARVAPLRDPAELSVSESFKEMLNSAFRESFKAGERTVSTTHLLLALAQERDSVASGALGRLGASAEAVRAEIRRSEDAQGSGPVAMESERDTPRPTSDVPLRTNSGADASPVRRRRAKLTRALQCLLLGQLLVFALLSLNGWGALPATAVDPPRMERVGAPPSLTATYASLSHITFPLVGSAGGDLATAAFAGTPGDWGRPPPSVPSLNVFGQSPSTTLHALTPGEGNTIMFVVPSAALTDGPLFVLVRGERHRLSLVSDQSSHGFAIVATTVRKQLLSAFASSLLWLTLPAPSPISVGLILIRRDPGAQLYALTRGTLGVTNESGVVAASVAGVTLGTPVVAIKGATGALAGFLETKGSDSTSFVATSVVAGALDAVAPSVSGGS
jgi:hypothetical protein